MERLTQNKVVPQLRFSEFEGEWNKEPIGKHFDLMSGFSFRSEDISEDSSGVPILRGINITEGFIRHSKKIDRYFLGDTSKLDRLRIKVGDLVLGMDGSKVGKNSALITDKDAGSLLIQRVARLREKKTSCLSFIYSHINSIRFHKYVDVVNTSSGIPHISSKQINEFKIFFPKALPEQQKIASFLTAVDDKIQKLTKKKQLLEQYKKGVMQQLFSQEIRFKDKFGNDYPDWEEKKLGGLFDFSRGGVFSKSDMCENGNLKCIHYGQLFTTYNEVIKEINYLTNKTKGVLSKSGDILMPSSDVTPIGLATASCILEDNVLLGGDINILRPKVKLDSSFYSYSLNYEKKKIIQLVSGTTVKHIYNKDIKTLKFKTSIAYEEQFKISSLLSRIDNKIELVNDQLKHTQTFKKGLLQQMFV